MLRGMITHLCRLCCLLGYYVNRFELDLQDKQKEGLFDKLCQRFAGTSGRLSVQILG